MKLARLDDLDIGPVGFLKVDVEGHELSMLRGAAQTVSRDRPTCLVESHSAGHPDAPHNVFEYFAVRSYHGYFVFAGQCRPVGEFVLEKHECIDTVPADMLGDFIFFPDPPAPTLLAAIEVRAAEYRDRRAAAERRASSQA